MKVNDYVWEEGKAEKRAEDLQKDLHFGKIKKEVTKKQRKTLSKAEENEGNVTSPRAWRTASEGHGQCQG